MRIATVTPVYRQALTIEEQISLRHLRHFLSKYDNVLVAPEGLRLDLPQFRIQRFPKRYFASVAGYNRLLLSRAFYEAFSYYDYILIYQLDCLVFSSDLDFWCNLGWDYIGAPWFKGFANRCSVESPLWAVGNGGFSLRNISSFLDVFGSTKRWVDPDCYWAERYASKPLAQRAVNWPKHALKKMGFINDIAWHLKRREPNEDIFWGCDASHFKTDFRVAPLDLALSFAFEKDPCYCFGRNGRRLPFGCHGWATYDKAFWAPYLISDAATK